MPLMAIAIYTAAALPFAGIALWLVTDNAAWLALCAPAILFAS